MAIMEERLTLTENRVSSIIASHRGNNENQYPQSAQESQAYYDYYEVTNFCLDIWRAKIII